MKLTLKIFSLITVSTILAPLALAQNVTVTGTITDTQSTPYSNGSLTVSLVNTTGQQATFGGSPSFQKVYSATLNSSGAFSISLPPNSTASPSISPTGTQWNFSYQSQGGYGAANVSVTITGAADISGSLSGLARITWPYGNIPPPGGIGQGIVFVTSTTLGWGATTGSCGSLPTTPNNMPYGCVSTPSGGIGQNAKFVPPGTQSFSVTTLTYTYGSTNPDDGALIERSNASNMTDTLNCASAGGWNSITSATNPTFYIYNIGAGSLAINIGTGGCTFTQGTSTGLAAISIPAGSVVIIQTDPSFNFAASPAIGVGGQVPTSAGAAPTTNGLINYDTTANEFKGGVNTATNIIPTVAGTTNPSTDFMAWWGVGGTLKDRIASGGTTVSNPGGSGLIDINNITSGDVWHFTNTNIVAFLGTNDIFLRMVPAGGSAYTGLLDGGSTGLGLATALSTTPVVIAPNKAITAKFPPGGGQQTAGTATTCTFTSGGGTSPSCTVDTGSNNEAGIIIATTGTGAPALTGTITLTFSANYGTNKPVCVYMASENGAGQWGSLATFSDKTPAIANDLFNWTNATGATPAGVALSTSTAYWINYHCFGK